MKFRIYILFALFTLMSVFVSCVNEKGSHTAEGPKIMFMAEDLQSKAFIDQINRSGNELVVYDYMTIGGQSEWYIDHIRIRCGVDGQEVWDYVNDDEYFWLYGSSHKCFGWLYSGPSGNNTVTFFKDHPEFEKETSKLPLPIYEFTLDSPVYDFLYSDITTREYSKANPDASSVPLHMNHLFSAFRFKVRNVRMTEVVVNSVTLKVVATKKAEIDFSHQNDVAVSYSEIGYGEFTIKNKIRLETMSDSYNIFPMDDDNDAFRMIWPQTNEELQNALLTINYTEYTEEGTTEDKVQDFKLSKFADQWLSGKRYAYDVVFSDKEIALICNVEDWYKKTINLGFTEIVVVSDKIQWNNSTLYSLDEEQGLVVLKGNGDAGECYFKIDEPDQAKWTASLISVEGATDAFSFVDPDDDTKVAKTAEGDVGKIAKLKIKVNNTGTTDTNKAKLRIIVHTADQRSIVVENLCHGHDFTEYTIVQNMQ